MHFVYIVRCADGTLYTGYARDPRARERAHNSGRGAKYTAGRRPVRLVYQEAFRSVGKALAREYVVKQFTRAQKDALVVSGRRRRHWTPHFHKRTVLYLHGIDALTSTAKDLTEAGRGGAMAKRSRKKAAQKQS